MINLTEDNWHNIFDLLSYQPSHLADDIQFDTDGDNAHYAASIPLTCRQLYLPGMKHLWRYVSLFDSKSLHKVSSQATVGCKYTGDMKLATYTKRLEVRIDSQQDVEIEVSKLGNILKSAVNLEVFILRDDVNGTALGHPTAFDSIQPPLCTEKHRLRRVQLESAILVPTTGHILSIMDSNIQLRTLRIARLSPSIGTWTPASDHSDFPRRLALLSLGVESGAPVVGIESLLTTMSTNYGGKLSVRELEVLQPTPVMTAFLRVFGAGLTRIRYRPGPLSPGQQSDGSWIQHCPHLDQLEWLIMRAHTSFPPDGHPNITRMKLEYHKDLFENPWEALNHLEDTLDTIRYGDYPRLAEIMVVMRGMNLPNIEDFDWLGTDEEIEQVVELPSGDGWSVSVKP